MNRKGRYSLYMSIGLAVLVIIQASLLIAFKSESRQVLWSMFSLIILIAMVAVVVAYRNVEQLKTRVKNLPKDYQNTYIDAQEAIGFSSMPTVMKKEINSNILEIFEHAHLEGRAVEEVINYDLNAFLQPFLEVSGSTHSFLYLMSYASLLFVGYLLLMKVYKVTRIGFSKNAFATETLDMGIVGTYAIIAFIFFPALMIIRKKASQYQWQGLKRLIILIPFIIPFGLMSLLILSDDDGLRNFLDKSFPIFNSLLAFVIGIILFLLLIVMMKFSQKYQYEKAVKRM